MTNPKLEEWLRHETVLRDFRVRIERFRGALLASLAKGDVTASDDELERFSVYALDCAQVCAVYVAAVEAVASATGDPQVKVFAARMVSELYRIVAGMQPGPMTKEYDLALLGSAPPPQN